MKRFGLTLVLAVLPCAALADTFIWDQPAFGVFHFGSSWQGGVAPGPGDQAVMGATLTTVFNPITVQFSVDSDVAYTDLAAGDYAFEGGNPGVLHTTQYFRVGWSDLPPEYPDDARLTINVLLLETTGIWIGDSGQTGLLSLLGTDTQLTSTGDIWVGYAKAGSLQILDGALVDAGSVKAGNGAQPGTDAIVVDGTGSSLDATGALEIGRTGLGTLSAMNGAAVTAGFASAGTFVDGDGVITVDGVGTSLTSDGALEIGRDGVGALTVSNGATVVAGFISAGTFAHPSSNGTILVDGTGASLSSAGALEIGRDGVGAMTVRAGALVTAAFGSTGTFSHPTSNGSIILDGTGSILQFSGGVEIGRLAPGSLVITNQAELMTGAGAGVSFVGTHPGGMGSVTISGSNNGDRSQWMASDSIYLGYYGGTGTVEVLDGGLLAVGYELHIAGNSALTVSSLSFVTVGDASLIAGAVSIGQNFRLSGGGTINGNVVNTGGWVAPDGSNAGTLSVLTIDGDYSHESSGALLIELAGQVPGMEHDKLVVMGQAALGGSLFVTLNPGYIPPTGAAFEILSANMIDGEFNSVYLPSLAIDQRWHLAYGSQVVSLTVVPAADLDNDGDVDLDDFALFGACVQGPGIPPSSACKLADLDSDADVDLLDFAKFQTAFGN